jgi:uncharacterized metal-binding protein YceD (DUF177 family)
MNDPIEKRLLSCPVLAADIHDDGRTGHIEADASARAVLVERLDLAALDLLTLDYALAPVARGRFRLTGRWSARAEQICGVTLEPIPLAFDEDVSVEYWTPDAWERYAQRGEVTFGPDQDAPEIIEHGEIDPGRLLEELFIVALPPFPRREDAQLNWRESEQPTAGPFAELRSLSQRNRS